MAQLLPHNRCRRSRFPRTTSTTRLARILRAVRSGPHACSRAPIRKTRSPVVSVPRWKAIFELWERPFNWDVGASYGKNKFDLVKGRLRVHLEVERGAGSFVHQQRQGRLRHAGGAVGGWLCTVQRLRRPDRGHSGHVQFRRGRIRATLQDYRVDDYTANISGPLVALPAGDLAFAVGYEISQGTGLRHTRPVDRGRSSYSTTSPAHLPTSGSYDLNEVFAELDVPLLKDAGVRSFAGFLRGRAPFRIIRTSAAPPIRR